ncbi:MAG: hypothetical protein VCB25_11215, partial [Myxococcota bacterium]
LTTTPTEMVARSAEIATVLKKIIIDRKLYVDIQGKKYIVVEGWTTLGVMLGIVPHEVSSTRHDDGSWEAVVELRTIATGAKVGGASALCGTSCDKPWNKRSEPARKSMACTRATGKAFRLGFSFIMKLAGYEVTPAEEMPSASTTPDTGGSRSEKAATSPQIAAPRGQGHGYSPVVLPPLPKRKRKMELSEGVLDQIDNAFTSADPDQPDPYGPTDDDFMDAIDVLADASESAIEEGRRPRRVGHPPATISAKQHRMLMAVAGKANLDHDRLKGFLDADYDIRSTKDIKPESFGEILANVEKGVWK